MKIAHLVSTTWLALLLILTTSCTEVVTVPPPSDFDIVKEESYCRTDGNFSGNTIDGYAYYKRRNFNGSGLGAIAVTNYPIRRAEVRVLNASGTVVHCTETDDLGHYTFDLPDNDANYSVRIYSRSDNQYSRASVMQDPYKNKLYYISTSFVSDTTKTLSNILANADTTIDSTLRGGAFNILDQIYAANDYLLNNTGGTFTPTQKVKAYWEKGVNPVGYFGGDTSSGVSFYVPGTDRLYILGGIDGDISVSDTDHFDNSVIIHEYGHFLEDNYSKSDSPGGTHYGLYVIDPRLAWSEGFSTYLAAKVLNDPIYKDTVGIGQGYGYYYDMENNLNADNDPQDMPTAGQLGEGGFRELAVSRMLWAATDSLMPFSELWDAYVGDFKNTERFREMSLFLKVQDDNAGTDISALLDDDDKEMTATRSSYAVSDNPLTANNLALMDCRWSIQASDEIPISGNTFEKSNQFYSNDFFYYVHPGGTLSVVLDYDLAGLTTADLDLYIYKDGYTFGVGDDLAVYSNKSRGVASGEENGYESVSKSLAAGHYIINVMYYNHGVAKPATIYNLIVSSASSPNNAICR